MTATEPLPYRPGWGFDYRSPTGDVNDATMIRKNGVEYTVGRDANGNLTYTPVPTTPETTPTADQSAKQMLVNYLAQYGLASLAEWAWSKWQAGESFDQIKLELPDTPEYQARFPAMKDLSKKGRAISTDQYIALEQQYTALARAAGLPPELYDRPDDFTKIIAGEVSPAEFQDRLQTYTTAAYEVDPTVRDQLRRLYGIDEGHIAAWAINPDKTLPVLQRQFGATQAAAAAQRSSWGELGIQDAEMLSNVSPEQLAQGFGQLYQSRELFNQLPGEAGMGISQAEQLSAAFLGDSAAQAEIDRKARERKGVFSGGGQVAQSQQGFAGAG